MIAFLRKLIPFVRPYRSRFILGLCFGMLFAVFNAALLAAINLVTHVVFATPGTGPFEDSLNQLQRVHPWRYGLLEHWTPWVLALKSPATRQGLVLVIAVLPGVMLVRGVCQYVHTYLMTWVAVRAIADLRVTLFDHLQGLSLNFFNRSSTGELISRISNDSNTLQTLINSSCAVAVKDPLSILVLVAYLIFQQPRLTLISMLVFPVCVVPIIIYGRKVRKSSHAAQEHYAELTSVMQEAFTGHRIVKAYNLETVVSRQFKAASKDFVNQLMRIVRALETPGPLIEFFGSVGIALVLVYVALYTTPAARPDLSGFLQFVMSLFMMYQPIKAVSRLHNQLEQARAASRRVFELLETQSPIVDPPHPEPLRAAGQCVRFDRVDFHYGEKPVLHGIELTVPPGQMVALVGASGSGKTTLVNLLLRFFDPQGGAVRIGDLDLRQVALRDLRAQIAIVTQEVILFNDTIRYNIALGRPGATDAEIETAARQAQAHEFILEKPRGYDTVVGEKGVSLSGGQRQRLAIARALIKDAPILILDEATSALDTESERAVQATLDEVMRGRTTICIAHRLSTIRNADLIVVLSEGRIVETGRHAELIQRGGVYQKLYETSIQNPAGADSPG